MSAMPSEEIRKLPVDERLRRVEELWESVRADPESLPLTDAQRAELGRRLAAFRGDPNATDDIDTVLSRIRAHE